MLAADLSKEQTQAFDKLVEAVPKTFRPLIRPSLALQAEILGFQPEVFQRGKTRRPPFEYDPMDFTDPDEEGTTPEAGEIFTDGTSLVVVATERPASRSGKESKYTLRLYHIGKNIDCPQFVALRSFVESFFDIELSKLYYRARRFDDLKKEGLLRPRL